MAGSFRGYKRRDWDVSNWWIPRHDLRRHPLPSKKTETKDSQLHDGAWSRHCPQHRPGHGSEGQIVRHIDPRAILRTDRGSRPQILAFLEATRGPVDVVVRCRCPCSRSCHNAATQQVVAWLGQWHPNKRRLYVRGPAHQANLVASPVLFVFFPRSTSHCARIAAVSMTGCPTLRDHHCALPRCFGDWVQNTSANNRSGCRQRHNTKNPSPWKAVPDHRLGNTRTGLSFNPAAQ